MEQSEPPPQEREDNRENGPVARGGVGAKPRGKVSEEQQKIIDILDNPAHNTEGKPEEEGLICRLLENGNIEGAKRLGQVFGIDVIIRKGSILVARDGRVIELIREERDTSSPPDPIQILQNLIDEGKAGESEFYITANAIASQNNWKPVVILGNAVIDPSNSDIKVEGDNLYVNRRGQWFRGARATGLKAGVVEMRPVVGELVPDKVRFENKSVITKFVSKCVDYWKLLNGTNEKYGLIKFEDGVKIVDLEDFYSKDVKFSVAPKKAGLIQTLFYNYKYRNRKYRKKIDNEA